MYGVSQFCLITHGTWLVAYDVWMMVAMIPRSGAFRLPTVAWVNCTIYWKVWHDMRMIRNDNIKPQCRRRGSAIWFLARLNHTEACCCQARQCSVIPVIWHEIKAVPRSAKITKSEQYRIIDIFHQTKYSKMQKYCIHLDNRGSLASE